MWCKESGQVWFLREFRNKSCKQKLSHILFIVPFNFFLVCFAVPMTPASVLYQCGAGFWPRFCCFDIEAKRQKTSSTGVGVEPLLGERYRLQGGSECASSAWPAADARFENIAGSVCGHTQFGNRGQRTASAARTDNVSRDATIAMGQCRPEPGRIARAKLWFRR